MIDATEIIMIILLLSIYANILVSAGSSVQVYQTPTNIYTTGGDAKINCSHSVPTYNQILWYKQSEKTLQYLGYLRYGTFTPEPGVNVTMDGGANEKENCTITIKDLKVSSSGVYFCAARGEEAYFGQGTKLTVLDKDREAIGPQEVQILRPSEHECRSGKDKKRKKTLVCVASGFYPDHVKVNWYLNEKKVTDGVATDEAAREEKDENDNTVYKITSRLRVYAKQWENPGNTFKCVVKFFNGTVYTDYPKSIDGVTAETTSMSREKYMTTTQNFKVVYSVLTVKSCAYGAFVGFLVWKLQRFGGKQKY